MPSRRALTLRKEALTALAPGHLGEVRGRGISGSICIWLAPTYQVDCLNDISFEWCPEPPTLPIEDCV